ncbi:hypothetical protein [Tardiphaga sp.]|uniref:hypothetical protein n=1 Tax=Tardiphaga sp. TaxID=1926292 RepID=UPI00352B7F30
MQDRNWPGIATAVAILWILSTIIWLGIAGPVWHATASGNADPWIGFAGNALGAGVSLLAAIVAGIAAYRTVVPMQRQLGELVRQNNFDHYDRLRARVAFLIQLNHLVQRVNANLEVMDRSFALSGLGATAGRETAFARLDQSVERLVADRSQVWGDQNAQSLVRYFVDRSMEATTVVRSSLPGGNTAEFSIDRWQKAKGNAFQGGVAVYFRVEHEIRLLSSEISRLEPTILGIAPVPQFWAGDYPGPERLTAMYADRSNPLENDETSVLR